jgi:hypothetical protein
MGGEFFLCFWAVGETSPVGQADHLFGGVAGMKKTGVGKASNTGIQKNQGPIHLNRSLKAAFAAPSRAFFSPAVSALNLGFRENQSQKVAVSRLRGTSAWDSAQSLAAPGR